MSAFTNNNKRNRQKDLRNPSNSLLSSSRNKSPLTPQFSINISDITVSHSVIQGFVCNRLPAGQSCLATIGQIGNSMEIIHCCIQQTTHPTSTTLLVLPLICLFLRC